MQRGEVALVHVERVIAAAASDLTAKKELSENTVYGKSKKQKLKKVLQRMARNAADLDRKGA
jgi:hypothetical protein